MHNGNGQVHTEAPPVLFNQDAELAVIGSIIIDPQAIWQIADLLSPADFHNSMARETYRAMLHMAQGREAIDIMTLEERLGGKPAPADGWAYWLLGLLNVVPTSAHVHDYAQVVEQYAVRRRLLAAAEKTARLAYDDNDLETTLGSAETAIFSVRQGRSGDGVRSARDAALSMLLRLEERRNNDKVMAGLPSGFTDLDRLLRGFIAPFPYVLAARPGMGKSALAGNIAAHLSKAGKRVMFFAVEMTTEQVIQRLVAAETGIPLTNLRDGKLDNRQMVMVNEAVGRIGEWPLFIDDTPGITPGQIRAKVMRRHADSGLDMVIIDHLHEMNADTSKSQRHLELGDMMRSLKETAKLVESPMLIVTQLSRSLESRASKRPMMSDLRESGAIEEVAYVVMFLYRDEYYDELTDRPNIAEVIVPKNRDGATGTIDLFWNGKLTKFANLQRDAISF